MAPTGRGSVGPSGRSGYLGVMLRPGSASPSSSWESTAAELSAQPSSAARAHLSPCSPHVHTFQGPFWTKPLSPAWTQLLFSRGRAGKINFSVFFFFSFLLFLQMKIPLISPRKPAHVGLFLPRFIFSSSSLRRLSHGCTGREGGMAAAARTRSPPTARQGWGQTGGQQ